MNSAAVSASVDMHKFFHLGEQPSSSASSWHAGRVHHRYRMLNPASSIVERLGSIAHLHWNPREHMSPRVYVDKLLLSAARVSALGNPRDELIVKEVSAIMELMSIFSRFFLLATQTGQGMMFPVYSSSLQAEDKTRQRKRWATGRLCRVRQLDESASASRSVSMGLNATAGYDEDDIFELLRPVDMGSAVGVTNRTMIRRLKAESKQAELPASVGKLMEQLQGQLATKGVLDPLPLTGSVDRKRGTAMETDRLRQWLDSAEGKEWRNQRSETWSTASWSLPATAANAAASGSDTAPDCRHGFLFFRHPVWAILNSKR